jgi:hypothetical protein
MTHPHNSNKLGISCSIFCREIETLREKGLIDLPFKYLASMLHMKPDILDKKLQSVTERESSNGKELVVIYGDCCPRMSDYESKENIVRSSGLNCCEILLGSAEYKKLRAEGAFILMPEWTRRWKEVFKHHMGLEGELAKTFMKEMHTKLVYLDTGVFPVPNDLLEEISQYTGLPVSILQITLDQLAAAIKNTDRTSE